MTTPTDPVPDGELDAVIEASRELLGPVVRSDRAAVEALLHPDFTEIGASGRFWQRAENQMTHRARAVHPERPGVG